MNRWLKVVFLNLCGSALAVAGSICPAGNGANPFPYNPDNSATGCNVVITIAANGSVSTVLRDSNPYENSEDVLVGVQNNSASPVSTLNITGAVGSGIFGFDGDGICTYTFVGSGYCASGHSSDPADYYGPTSTFSNISSNGQSGTVNFSPAIPANGGTTFFSLEGIPSANLSVSTGPGGSPTPTPAPPSIVLLLTALGMMGIYFLIRSLAKPAVQ